MNAQQALTLHLFQILELLYQYLWAWQLVSWGLRQSWHDVGSGRWGSLNELWVNLVWWPIECCRGRRENTRLHIVHSWPWWSNHSFDWLHRLGHLSSLSSILIVHLGRRCLKQRNATADLEIFDFLARCGCCLWLLKFELLSKNGLLIVERGHFSLYERCSLHV